MAIKVLNHPERGDWVACRSAPARPPAAAPTWPRRPLCCHPRGRPKDRATLSARPPVTALRRRQQARHHVAHGNMFHPFARLLLARFAGPTTGFAGCHAVAAADLAGRPAPAFPQVGKSVAMPGMPGAKCPPGASPTPFAGIARQNRPNLPGRGGSGSSGYSAGACAFLTFRVVEIYAVHCPRTAFSDPAAIGLQPELGVATVVDRKTVRPAVPRNVFRCATAARAMEGVRPWLDWRWRIGCGQRSQSECGCSRNPQHRKAFCERLHGCLPILFVIVVNVPSARCTAVLQPTNPQRLGFSKIVPIRYIPSSRSGGAASATVNKSRYLLNPNAANDGRMGQLTRQSDSV